MEMDKERMRQWVAGWKRASERILALKKRDIRCVKTSQVIEDLNDAFESALLHADPSTTSGLVLQQRLFKKGKK